MSKVGKTARQKLFAPIFDPRAPRRRRPPATLRSATAGPLVNLTGELTFSAGDLAPSPPPPLPPDNLLLAVANGREIAVRVPLPPPTELGEVKIRDSVWLEIDGNRLPVPKVLVAADITNGYADVPLSIADRGGEGQHRIRYVIKLTSGDQTDHPGPSQQYVVDLTRPGDPTLADLEFPDAPDGFVTVDSIIDDGINEPYLLATVDGYSGLAPGDEIIGFIDGNEENLHSTYDGIDLSIHFTQSFIESQGDGDKEFSYEVVDRAGNRSIRSRVKLLKVLVKDAIRNLAPPSVPSYDNDTVDPKVIDEADARATGGLQVIIPANPSIRAGDDIYVLWGDAEVGPTAVPDPAQTTPVGVPYAPILDTWVEGGDEDDAPVPVTVHYRVERGGIVAGRTETGADVEVNLYQAGGVDPDPETPENENLGLPTLQSGEPGDPPNTISLAGFELDATVTIPWETVDASGTLLLDDVIDVQYGASGAIGPRTVLQDDVDAALPIELTLPKDTIQAEGSGDKALRYTVTRPLQENGPNVSVSPTQAVTVVGQDGLPGGGTLAPIEVPVATGIDPIDPDRLILAPRHAPAPTDTVEFVIPHYENQNTTDTVVVNVKAYDLFGYEVHTPPGIPEVPLPDRDMLDISVTVISTTADTIVRINGYDLLGFNPDPTDQTRWRAIHTHVTYKVTNAAGTVESTDQVLDIDGRSGPVNP